MTRSDEEGTSVFCTQCGHQLPEGARFCPACGTPVGDQTRPDAGEAPRAPHEVTTGAIDVGALDEREPLDELPELEAGTGMLVVVRGPGAGSRYLLDRDSTSIGRHPDSHIFLDDVTVSRRHAEVERSSDSLGLSVRDLGSLNGTYVNGERVEQRTLTTGDEVQIGRFKLLFAGSDTRVGGETAGA